MDQEKGISGWAGYMLGQVVERNRVSFEHTARSVHRRLGGQSGASVSRVISQVEYLEVQLKDQDTYICGVDAYIKGLEEDREKQRIWAEAIEAHVATLKQVVVVLQRKLSACSGEIEVLHGQYDIDTEALKIENEKLRRVLMKTGGRGTNGQEHP